MLSFLASKRDPTSVRFQNMIKLLFNDPDANLIKLFILRIKAGVCRPAESIIRQKMASFFPIEFYRRVYENRYKTH